MDWRRLGEVFDAWAMAVDGKHALYVEERGDDWVIHFSVSRPKGLMLAEVNVRERVAAAALAECGDGREFGRQLAAKMHAALAKKGSANSEG